MKTYDAVVIGARHNGLTNAAYLAKSGLNVLPVRQSATRAFFGTEWATTGTKRAHNEVYYLSEL